MKSFLGRIARSLARKAGGTITHVSTSDPVVALTFDDGPDPVTTPALLRILDVFGAKATFFMTGESAAAFPEVVAAVRDGGHAIGNHSWNHPSFPLISGSERRRQIRRTAGVLRSAGARIFRPPYGHQTAASRRDAWLAGHKVVTWSVCVPDWENHDGAWLADFALDRIKAGSVVLMHDGMVDFAGEHGPDRGPTLVAVEMILTALSGEYEFVTIPELLRRGDPVKDKWRMDPDVELLNRLNRRNGTPRRYAVPANLTP